MSQLSALESSTYSTTCTRLGLESGVWRVPVPVLAVGTVLIGRAAHFQIFACIDTYVRSKTSLLPLQQFTVLYVEPSRYGSTKIDVRTCTLCYSEQHHDKNCADKLNAILYSINHALLSFMISDGFKIDLAFLKT